MKLSRKALTIAEIGPIAIILVVAGIALGSGAQVLGNISTSLTAGSNARLAVDNTSLGLGQLAYWMPTIGLVVAAAIIIGVVFSAFVRGKAGE
jgi:ABC-type antimicrobial peptide transport system permease subunit